MTEYVDGKKYKLTVTGTFLKSKLHDLSVNRFHIDGTVDDILYPGTHLTAVLLPDPLPTAPGSVIDVDWALDGTEVTAVLSVDNWWYDNEGDSFRPEDFDGKPWTLVRDNGAN